MMVMKNHTRHWFQIMDLKLNMIIKRPNKTGSMKIQLPIIMLFLRVFHWIKQMFFSNEGQESANINYGENYSKDTDDNFQRTKRF